MVISNCKYRYFDDFNRIIQINKLLKYDLTLGFVLYLLHLENKQP